MITLVGTGWERSNIKAPCAKERVRPILWQSQTQAPLAGVECSFVASGKPSP